MQFEYDREQLARSRSRTYAIYGIVLVGILAVVLYSARQVIFRPWTARTMAAVSAYADGFYAFGGENSRNQFLDDILKVNLRDRTIHRAGHLPVPIIGASAVTVGDAIYLLGGMSRTQISPAVYRYDIKTARIQSAGELPGPRAYGAATAFDGLIYYFGGYDGSVYRDEVIRYDPSTGRSTVAGRLPAPVEELAVAATDRAIYVLGGEVTGGDLSSQVFEFIPTGTRGLERRLLGNLPAPRERAHARMLGGRLYLAGGWSNGVSNEVIELNLPVRTGTAAVPARGGDTAAPASSEKVGGNSPAQGSSPIAVHVYSDFTYDISESIPVAYDGSLYLVGGTEQRYRRQIQIIRFDPRDGSIENMELESYVWW